MTRRQAPQHPERSKLLRPLAQAERQVSEQIAKGEAMQESLLITPIATLAEDRKRWSDYTSELLLRICSSDELSRQFKAAASVAIRMNPSQAEQRGYEVNRIKYQIAALRSILEKLPLFENVAQEIISREPPPSAREVFLVHGRDDAAKSEVARFLEHIELHPIILHEQADRGRTIIEKFEDHSAEAGFAVVLLTPDDEGALVGEKPARRARQNVVFELGYFIGKLTRSRVCALKLNDVEEPSDLKGILYTTLLTLLADGSLSSHLNSRRHSLMWI